MAPEERWPPVYEPEELTRIIDDLAHRPDLEAAFYEPVSELTGPYCQGDVLSLGSGVPVLTADGMAEEIGDFEYWLGIGNTCDFARPLADVEWTQVVPLVDLREATADQLAAFRSYKPSRRFFVPPWPGLVGNRAFAADFLRPVALHRNAVGGAATVVARMSRSAWVLLHGCLIRFLCRDDGRYEQ